MESEKEEKGGEEPKRQSDSRQRDSKAQGVKSERKVKESEGRKKRDNQRGRGCRKGVKEEVNVGLTAVLMERGEVPSHAVLFKTHTK